MKADEFSRELDMLVKSGSRTVPDSDIDIEALHLTRTIREKIHRRGNVIAVTILLLLVLIGVVVLFFLRPEAQHLLGFDHTSEIRKNAPDTQVQITQLNLEKEELLKNIDSLRQQLEAIKTAPRADTTANGTGSQSEMGADGIIRHVVDRGETLYRIAEKYYGDGMLYKTLQEDNKLKTPQDLAEGMTLKIYPDKKRH